jgi:hypothetical protein
VPYNAEEKRPQSDEDDTSTARLVPAFAGERASVLKKADVLLVARTKKA